MRKEGVSQVEDYIEKMKELYKIEQCKRITEVKSEKDKWKIINKLTNSNPRVSVQPIRKMVDGKEKWRIITFLKREPMNKTSLVS